MKRDEKIKKMMTGEYVSIYKNVETSLVCLICNKEYIKTGNFKSFCPECLTEYFTTASGRRLQGTDFTREYVRIRDNHTCQMCLKRWVPGTRRFDIHHLNGLCGKLSRSYDKVEDIGNLVTYCHKCHLNLPEVKEKMSNKSSPRPNKYGLTL